MIETKIDMCSANITVEALQDRINAHTREGWDFEEATPYRNKNGDALLLVFKAEVSTSKRGKAKEAPEG